MGKGGIAKSTTCIRNFHLRRSQFTKDTENSFVSLFSIYTAPNNVLFHISIFICRLNLSGKKKNYSYGRVILEEHLRPLPFTPQVTPKLLYNHYSHYGRK